jgi:hypothetical protein
MSTSRDQPSVFSHWIVLGTFASAIANGLVWVTHRHLESGLSILGIGRIAVAIGLVVLVGDWLPRRRPPRRALPQDSGRSPLFDRELDGLP